MSVNIPPGCIMRREAYYSNLWDSKPGDSDKKVQRGPRVVRLAGVMLVDRLGQDRSYYDIYQDMFKRIEYLKSRKAPKECIEMLELYIRAPKTGENNL